MQIFWIMILLGFGLTTATPAFAAMGHPFLRAVGEGIGKNFATAGGKIRTFLQTHASLIGASITGINGTTLTVSQNGKTYTVLTDGNTQDRRRYWGKGSITEMQVGDTVNVYGTWTDSTNTTIQAKLVRDVSIQKYNGVFFGTVQSLTSSGWTMTTVERGNQTVTVSSTTKFKDRKGGTLAQSDIAVGHKIRVRGLWDRTSSTITEVTEVRDFSLPVKATVTPTVTPTP